MSNSVHMAVWSQFRTRTAHVSRGTARHKVMKQIRTWLPGRIRPRRGCTHRDDEDRGLTNLESSSQSCP